MQVDVVDRQQQIEICEHEIKRKLCELDAVIKRPAEAEKYRLEMLAGKNSVGTTLQREPSSDLKLKE